mmetsp:Transcript_26424/g.47940  ORF Transcript_26424/g.47940 Transcript_26424/m.47940 type:complete len:420 (-) Transcript_26424:121-1380(-)
MVSQEEKNSSPHLNDDEVQKKGRDEDSVSVKENMAHVSDKEHKRRLETDQDAASQEKKKQKVEQAEQLDDDDKKEVVVNAGVSEEVEVEMDQAPQVDEISQGFEADESSNGSGCDEEKEPKIDKEKDEIASVEPEVQKARLAATSGFAEFKLATVNRHLICCLCEGYFRDPYTIAECLHSFCKSCLHFAFQRGYRQCPSCKLNLDPDPFKNAISDRTLQGLVDKLFPHLKGIDDETERDFYKQRGFRLKPEYAHLEEEHERRKKASSAMDESSPRKMRALRSNRSSESFDTNVDDASDVAPDLERRTSTHNETSQTLGLTDDPIEFMLEPDNSVTNRAKILKPLANPLILTSGRLKVAQLKKYIMKELRLDGNGHMVDILCNSEPIGDELSLTFVHRTLLHGAKGALTLQFRFAEESLY